MKFRVAFIVICLIACIICISSCASLGPVYQSADTPTEKAVIYVYRPWRIYLSVRYYSLWDVTDAIAKKKVNIVYDQGKDYPRIDTLEEGMKYGKKLARIVNGSYYAYTVDPGVYYFLVEETGQWGTSGADLVTRVDAKAGKRYFFASHPSFIGAAPSLEFRTVAQGEEEIPGCKMAVEGK